jgi:hypothetical protein
MRRDLILFTALLYVGPLALLVAVAVVSATTGLNTGLFMRDPASTMGAHPLTGVVSNVGVIGWTAAAVICLFVWAKLRPREAYRSRATFLLVAGLITTVLMLDDFFMLHERIFPRYFGLHEKSVFGAYGLLVVGWLVAFRRQIVETDYAVLIISLAFFGFSLAVDYVQNEIEALIGPWRILLEDGTKLFGIAGWLGYFLRVGLEVNSE